MRHHRNWIRSTLALLALSAIALIYFGSVPGSSQSPTNTNKPAHASDVSSDNEKRTDPSSDDQSEQQSFPDEVCSIGGCSVGHHSVPALSKAEYDSLLKKFVNQPISSESKAYEELIYYGRQTRGYINQYGLSPLGERRSNALRTELSKTKATISFRVTDETGTVRLKLSEKTVPLGESKHFEIDQTHNVQTPELSGTVYRVGVNHLWARY